MTVYYPPGLAEQTNNQIVMYPHFLDVLKDIGRCQELSRNSYEPSCITLTGVTGAGKSTLVRAYVQEFPRYETESGTKVPICYVETPSSATPKRLVARMLEQLGDPIANTGSQWQMDSRLRHFIRACEVQMVILDDIHHLIDSETNRILEKASDWLKVLIRETGVPFLAVGITGKVDLILRSNPELSRLFATRDTLAAFPWDPRDKATTTSFGAFVRFAERAIGMDLPIALDEMEIFYRIHYCTDGVVGYVMTLLRFGVILAKEQNLERLTLPVLSLAFSKALEKHMLTKVDPFSFDPGAHFSPPPVPIISPMGKSESRPHGKRKVDLTPNQVLRAT